MIRSLGQGQPLDIGGVHTAEGEQHVSSQDENWAPDFWESRQSGNPITEVTGLVCGCYGNGVAPALRRHHLLHLLLFCTHGLLPLELDGGWPQSGAASDHGIEGQGSGCEIIRANLSSLEKRRSRPENVRPRPTSLRFMHGHEIPKCQQQPNKTKLMTSSHVLPHPRRK